MVALCRKASCVLGLGSECFSGLGKESKARERQETKAAASSGSERSSRPHRRWGEQVGNRDTPAGPEKTW